MKIRNIFNAIDKINETVGGAASYLILASLVVILIEVLMRYAFSASQVWSSEMSVFLFGTFFTLGGGYTLFHEGHVRMDIFYVKLSSRGKAIMDIATFVLFFAFVGILIWKGWDIAIKSLRFAERSESAWAPLLWPTKMLIPVGGFLILLQGLAQLGRNILTLSEKKPASEQGQGAIRAGEREA
jgi:TRAP-type mannitol/chloroaromatic compound transport system permease small subunit